MDDLIYTGNDVAMIENFKRSMMVEFDMSDLGMMHYILDLEVNQSAEGIFLSQKKYVQDILDRFQLENCNSMSTPMEKGLKGTSDFEIFNQLEIWLVTQIVTMLEVLKTEKSHQDVFLC